MIVAAPGPSLTTEVAEICRSSGWPTVVCQDAWRRMPWADVLYGCDGRWWDTYEGVPAFAGEKWTSRAREKEHENHKAEQIEKYGLRWVLGAGGSSFSMDPSRIFFGDNSGFQTINLALLFGATYLVLVGYDMRVVKGRGHFFGDHPAPLFNQDSYEQWAPQFARAAKTLPPGITIINATPNSALRCWPYVPVERAIEDYRLYSHGTVSDR